MRSILLPTLLIWCRASLVVLAEPAAPKPDAADVEIAAAEWGSLSLRLVYDGDPPRPPRPLGDVRVFEPVIVNADDRGIANVCVYLDLQPGEAPVSVHPDYAKNPGIVTMTAAEGRFDPHVLVANTSQILRLSNADAIGYNFNANFFHNRPFNVLLQPGKEWFVLFQKPEAMPSVVSSSIHPWMQAYVLVRDNPYAAVSDKSGHISIANLPVGKHTFIVWHEAAGYVRALKVGGKDIELHRGRWEVEIKPGGNDLGEIKLKPDVFRRP